MRVRNYEKLEEGWQDTLSGMYKWIQALDIHMYVSFVYKIRRQQNMKCYIKPKNLNGSEYFKGNKRQSWMLENNK